MSYKHLSIEVLRRDIISKFQMKNEMTLTEIAKALE